MDALADEMATVITLQMAAVPQTDPSAPDPSRADTLRAAGHRIRQVLLSYRDGARLFSGTHLTDTDALNSSETALRALTGDGLALADTVRALQTLNAYVVGFVIEEQHRNPVPGEPDPRYEVSARQARVDPGQAPLNHAASQVFFAPLDETFSWGLEALIAGIAARTGAPI